MPYLYDDYCLEKDMEEVFASIITIDYSTIAMETTTTAQKHTVAAMDTTVEVRRVAGVDGCRTGWVVASLDGCRVVERLDDSAGDFDVIGVDMPIGLPVTGPRRCDVDARKFGVGVGASWRAADNVWYGRIFHGTAPAAPARRGSAPAVTRRPSIAIAAP